MLPAKVKLKSETARGIKLISRDVTVLTPMFGGGVHVEPDKPHQKLPDPVTPMRGATVRGQLRFWWRAMYGCQFELAEMKRIEAKIWGRDADQETGVGPSPVALRIVGQPQAARCNPFEGADREIAALRVMAKGIEYGAFPLRSAQQGVEPGWLTRLSGTTTVELQVRTATLNEAELQSIDDAMDAWLLLGGIGGRTRRGFGAVAGAETTLDALLARACDPRPGSRIPNLRDARYTTSPQSSQTAVRAWASGLTTLRDMRQGLGNGRNRKSGETGWRAVGRSNWPDPDEIRRLTRKQAKKNTPRTGVQSMPRAAFGLPIVFAFKTSGDNYGDPGNTTLQPADHERLASPVIIRPHPDGNGRFKTLALVLGGSRASDLKVVLKAGKAQIPVGRTTLTRAEAGMHPHNNPLQGEADPLQAFLNLIAQPRS